MANWQVGPGPGMRGGHAPRILLVCWIFFQPGMPTWWSPGCFYATCDGFFFVHYAVKSNRCLVSLRVCLVREKVCVLVL